MADPDPLAVHLARYLRQRRGERSYARFAVTLGMTPAMAHRYEHARQSITLRGLYNIMQRLNCGLADIFPVECQRPPSQQGSDTSLDR